MGALHDCAEQEKSQNLAPDPGPGLNFRRAGTNRARARPGPGPVPARRRHQTDPHASGLNMLSENLNMVRIGPREFEEGGNKMKYGRDIDKYYF